MSTGDPLADPHWDEAVLSHGEAGFFHCSAWARVLVDAYGFSPFYLSESSLGRIDALLPLMEVRSFVTGRRGVSLPFSDYCEPLMPDDYPVEKLLEALTRLGRDRKWQFVDLHGGKRIFGDAPTAATFFVHTIELTPDESGLFNQMKESTRRNVRKARREGVAIAYETSLESLDAFCRLNCLTRKEHGLPPQPDSFFRSIHRNVLSKGQGVVILAKVNGQPAAGAMFFHFGHRALYKYGASDRRFLAIRPNELIMWEAMRWYRERGFTELCLGRTELRHEGLRRYKAGFGASERSLSYYRYEPRRGGFQPMRQRSGGVTSGVFKRLPPSLSRLIGKLAYRHVA